MYKNRVKVSLDELNYRHRGAKYMITNRVIGGSYIFGDVEKKKLLELLFEGQNRHGYHVLDYVLLDNHYHFLLEVAPPETMSDEQLLNRWYMQSRVTGNEPEKEELEAFRLKIHDISFVVGNFEQRFVQWYNKRNNRLGSLFNRFDSVIIGGGEALATLMAYTTLNPVRADIVSDPAEYHWCGYANRVANGCLNEYDLDLVKDLRQALNIPAFISTLSEKKQRELLWKYFRKRLLRSNIRAHSHGDLGAGYESVGDKLSDEGKSHELGKAKCFMLKVRFATKGIAIGSEEFVENILATCGKVLGYKREHHAQDYHVWDHIHSLKRHRKVTW